MNAGKSTTLLQSSHNYKERGMETLLFAPAIDTRFGKPTIYSRIGLMEEAAPFDDRFDFFAYVKERQSEMSNLGCVLIDEAHFLKKEQVAQLTEITTKLNLPVLAYGLRSDFLGMPFEGSVFLLAWAQEITEIKTICYCGRKATMNMRIDASGKAVTEGEQIQVGGNESYQATCLYHFKESVPFFAKPVLERV